MSSYFVHKDGDRYGPLSLDQLQEYVDAGQLHMEDMAAEEGADEWVPLSHLLEDQALVPEIFREKETIDANRESAPVPEAEVSDGRKRAAIAVLGVGLVGGGLAVGWWLWPKPTEPAPNHEEAKAPEVQQPAKPEVPPVKLPPAVPATLELVDETATELVLQDARQGNALARLYVGIRRYEGWGLPVNRALAYEAVSESARAVNGPIVAKMYLGQLILRGRVSPGQAAEARQMLQPDIVAAVHAQARKGDRLSQYVYGLNHHPRPGFRGQPGEALSWFRRAAEQGFAPAQYQMGLNALTLKKPDIAARWFAAAARQRHGMALQHAGLDYLTGRYGVAKNTPEGLRLTMEAGQLGNVQARRGLAFMYETGSAGETNQVEACAWYLVLAPKEIMARNKVKQMYDALPAPEYMQAVTRAREIEPLVRIPLFAPPAPMIGKPESVEPAALPQSPAERIQTTLRRIGAGDAVAVWEALPMSYQTEVVELVKQGGERLNPELHAATKALMAKSIGLLKDKEIPLQTAVIETTGLPAEQVKAGWAPVVAVLELLVKSKLSEPDWWKKPDVAQLIRETGNPLVLELDRISKQAGSDAGILAELKTVTCVGEEIEEGYQVILRAGEKSETMIFQEVEGKWLPVDWVEQWPAWMAAARSRVAPSIEEPGAPGRQTLLATQLRQLEEALDGLTDDQLAGQLGQFLEGIARSGDENDPENPDVPEVPDTIPPP